MAKLTSVYACGECGATALQWFGTCPSCGAAGTLSESYAERGAKRIATPSVALADIEARELARIPTGVGELDRALGAGLVAGQVVLLGGDPGIGKSTLLLQTLATLKEVLYITGEESAEQIAMRARRLSLDAGGVRRRHAGGHAAVAGRDPSPSRRRPRAQPAPAFGGPRAEPPRHAARRTPSPRRHRHLGAGRVRQRRRRRAHRRAGGRRSEEHTSELQS